MSLGLIGRKCGMTRIFTEDGDSIPVTVITVEPNRVTQLKTVNKDGYSAVQVTVGSRRASRVTAPMAGHYAKANVQAGRGLWEFRANGAEIEDKTPGSEIVADYFQAGQKVDITGTTIGKGFAGVVKRHHFAMKDATHGNSINHRTPGSIGQNQTPGRVFKGKKMTGHMGCVKRTIQNIEVVRVDAEKNLILVKGAVPGSKGSDVIIKAAVKSGATN